MAKEPAKAAEVLLKTQRQALKAEKAALKALREEAADDARQRIKELKKAYSEPKRVAEVGGKGFV